MTDPTTKEEQSESPRNLIRRKTIIPTTISLPDLSLEIERVAHLLCSSLNNNTFSDPQTSPVLPYISTRFEAVFSVAHSSTATSDFDEHMEYYRREHAAHPNVRYEVMSVAIDPMLFEAGRVDAHCFVEIRGRPEGLRRETVQCHKWRREGEEGWRWFSIVNMRGHSGSGF